MSIKKTVVHINAVNYGSTGNIMRSIAGESEALGFDSFVCCADSRSNRRSYGKNQIFIGNRIERNIHIRLATITGLQGCFSHVGTWRFLRRLDKIKPDIIHLHNIYSNFINIPMLFGWIKKNKIKVVWTLHDCWSFTGKCPHFIMANCMKWKTRCGNCTQCREYPVSYCDSTRLMHSLKKKWFSGIDDMTIVTPSAWLRELVKESFLKSYPVQVINNGVDLSTFKPVDSDFRERHNIRDKFMVLGVAFGWGRRKGLDVFKTLSGQLGDDYQIVLIGTDKKVLKDLPSGVISINKTDDRRLLAQLYTTADVFVNPTREEVFGLVNIEALACGTPVVTFKTGGSPECIDEISGSVVECDDIAALKEEIVRICEEKPYSSQNCINRAKQNEMSAKCREYIGVYDKYIQRILRKDN